MTIPELLDDVFANTAPLLAETCAAWMASSRRFRVFLETYRGKVRKKARSLRDTEGERDLLCELQAAFLLLSEPRVTVEYEKHGLGERRTPDLTATYRTRLPFHVEVKRIRASAGVNDAAEDEGTRSKMREIVCHKIGQMLPEAVNLLWLAVDGARPDLTDLQAAMKELLHLAEHKRVEAPSGQDYFAARGFRDATDFLRQSQRLSGILLMARWDSAADSLAWLWTNPRARRPLPTELQRLLPEMRAALYGRT